MWVNALPSSKGASQKYSPREIVTGQHPEFKNHCRVVFRPYVEAHDEPNITNKMAPRIHEYISLRPTRNIQGTQKLFCLRSGIVLKRRNIIRMITSDCIIKLVEYWGGGSRGEKYGKVIEICNRNKELFDWENEEVEE